MSIRPKSSFLCLEHDFLKLLISLKIRGASYQIALFIYQQTIGFDKPSAPLSESWISRYTGYSKVTVSLCLEKLREAQIIQIEIPKENPWKMPRIISLKLDRFRKEPVSVKESLTVKEIETVEVLRAQETLPRKIKEEIKNKYSPLIPLKNPPDGGEVISQEHEKAKEMVDLFCELRGITKHPQSLKSRDTETVLHWRQEGYSWEVIQRAVTSVAKQVDTKSIKRAEYRLGEVHHFREKEKCMSDQKAKEEQKRNEEIESVCRERDEIEMIRKNVSPEEIESLSQDIQKKLKAEKNLPDFLLPSAVKQQVNQILRRKYGHNTTTHPCPFGLQESAPAHHVNVQ